LKKAALAEKAKFSPCRVENLEKDRRSPSVATTTKRRDDLERVRAGRQSLRKAKGRIPGLAREARKP
jgi:hypothetical protein